MVIRKKVQNDIFYRMFWVEYFNEELVYNM